VGDTAVVSVWANEVTDFYGAQFSLSFDENVLEGVSVEPGSVFTDNPDEYEVAQAEIVSGTVDFAAALLRVPKAGPFTGNAEVAVISFTAVNTATCSALAFGEVKLSDSSGEPIAFTTVDGCIDVVEPPPQETTLTGYAFLEGRDDSSDILVELAGAAVLSTTTDISGTYAFVGLPAGTYTMTLSYGGFLPIEVPDVVVVADSINTLCSYMLLAGDVTGDGVVDILDLVMVGNNFGGPGPDGDVNGDGIVDIYDLVLVGKNFKLEGTQPGQCLS
jgi:hypothetical protein